MKSDLHANRHDVPNPWHREFLEGPLFATYVEKLVQAFGLQGDSSAFYAELARQTDVLMPHLLVPSHATPIVDFIDDRMIKYIFRYLASGTDRVFEGLCNLASKIVGPHIDAVLARLFQRFCTRARAGSPDAYELWRGFSLISNHPRFERIPEWQQELSTLVLSLPPSYHREILVRVLERDPRSYLQIERLLFKAENFVHFMEDEVERLDAAAERLFLTVLES